MIVSTYKEEKEDKDRLLLRLFDHGDGVVLSVVRRDGTVVGGGELLKITLGGELQLFGNINSGLGLSLVKSGYMYLKLK